MRTLVLALLPSVAFALPANTFYWPSSNTGVSVCAYYDHGGQDWAGGGNRYSGHRGTDIALGVGNDALAAAPGTITARTDGCPYGYVGSTCGGGFGNHVAIFHGADTTYYGHMSAGSGIAGYGGVGCGTRLGATGSSGSSSGPHLHFEVRVGSSGGAPYSGTSDDPYAGPVGGPISYWVNQGGGYSSACGVGTTSPAAAVGCDNKAPRGSLDVANCDGVGGWAQDENSPVQAIDVHLYFNGPVGVGASLAVNAGHTRQDLCGPLGSCEHGFSLLAPRSLIDGQPHAVHAYAIDTAGGSNPELPGSPMTLTCAQLPAAGTRRWVRDQAHFAAWGFSEFQDVQPMSDAQLADYKEAEDFPEAPKLVRADGQLAVYAIDRGLRRHVASPAVAAAWRLDLNSVQVLSPEEVDAIQLGPPLRSRPFLVQASTPAIYAIDDPLPPASVLVDKTMPESELRRGSVLPQAMLPKAAVPRPPGPTITGGNSAPSAQNDFGAAGGCSAAPGAPLFVLALMLRRRRTARR
jgi:hypothetical protein